jgi:polyhydroxybutyrate depolymerase
MQHPFCILAILVALTGAAHAAELADGGRTRSYLVHRPADLGRANPAPLVIVLHGGFGSGAQAEKSYNWDAEADHNGFVVVYPDGIGRSWNAGGICCGPAQRKAVDDVGFLTHLIETVSRSENIDRSRIYLTGISNGAAMAYRYGCEGPLPVAAIGGVSGSFSTACPKTHAVSVMEIHGLDDRSIPFAGGHGKRAATKVEWQGAQQTLDAFRKADRCAAPSLQQNGPLQTATSHCAGGHDVVLIAIAGAGHQWPGGQRERGLVPWLLRLDPPSTALDATSTLWAFFRTHSAD